MRGKPNDIPLSVESLRLAALFCKHFPPDSLDVCTDCAHEAQVAINHSKGHPLPARWQGRGSKNYAKKVKNG